MDRQEIQNKIETLRFAIDTEEKRIDAISGAHRAWYRAKRWHAFNDAPPKTEHLRELWAQFRRVCEKNGTAAYIVRDHGIQSYLGQMEEQLQALEELIG
jgi:hypothetical protein